MTHYLLLIFQSSNLISLEKTKISNVIQQSFRLFWIELQIFKFIIGFIEKSNSTYFIIMTKT